MRWLQNISFSNNTSNNNNNNNSNSNSSAPSSPKQAVLSTSASSSSSSFTIDSNFSSSKRNQRSYLRGGALALRFGVGAPKLSRQRKLRYFTENDATKQQQQQQQIYIKSPSSATSSTVNSTISSVKSSPSIVNLADVAQQPLQLSRSPSNSSAIGPPRLSSSVPVPLPLPLPVQAFGDGDLRFPSPKDKEKEKDRDGVSLREKDKERISDAVNGDGLPSSTKSPIAKVFVVKERRRIVDPLDIKSSPRKIHPDFCVDNYADCFKINAPTRSAPTSPFGSPVVSPQRTSAAANFSPYYQMMVKNQVWSAPEMATYDPGLPPPAFFDCTTYSADGSPLHSPPSVSPRRRSPNGPASPLNAKPSMESSIATLRENSATLEVHPLPLPPGASRSSVLSSPTVSQVVSKPESVPMKSQWRKGKLIGRGTFGSVYCASNRETGALCAMKEVDIFPDDPKSAESIKQLEQEIKVLSQLKHPNIVQYYGSEIVGDHFYIYLEYVHPGSINKYVREHCGAITENVVRSFSRHILSGLAYLHSMKTIHRDIKGANLLVDASGVVKLADFGMSKHLTGPAAELSLKGSPYWMAPELMQAVMQKDTSSDLALAVDIWSLGCTIIEMFTGKPPWSDYEGAAAMFKVLRDIPPIPETLSPEGKDFLRCCFRRNPADRPSASLLLEHRWLKNSQQLDCTSPVPPANGIKLMDLTQSSYSSEAKLDQIQSTKQKAASESFMHYSFSSARIPSDLVTKLPS